MGKRVWVFRVLKWVDIFYLCMGWLLGKILSQFYSVIQGPPGTGKTYTLLGIVKNLLGYSRNVEPLRLLICAPSNGAVDEIGRRLLRETSFGLIRMVRIGIQESIHPDLHHCMLDQVTWTMASEQEGRSRKFGDIRQDLILEADVILSTLASSQARCMMPFRMGKGALPVLIVDEAGQCSEPELMLPLIYPSVSKIILIGKANNI